MDSVLSKEECMICVRMEVCGRVSVIVGKVSVFSVMKNFVF